MELGSGRAGMSLAWVVAGWAGPEGVAGPGWVAGWQVSNIRRAGLGLAWVG